VAAEARPGKMEELPSRTGLTRTSPKQGLCSLLESTLQWGNHHAKGHFRGLSGRRSASMALFCPVCGALRFLIVEVYQKRRVPAKQPSVPDCRSRRSSDIPRP